MYINTIEKRRTASSNKNTNSCPKTFNKTVTGYIFYHTSKILQTNKKTIKISLFNAIAKTFKDVKFTVDSSAFQTFITLSTKNFRLMLAVHVGCIICNQTNKQTKTYLYNRTAEIHKFMSVLFTALFSSRKF